MKMEPEPRYKKEWRETHYCDHPNCFNIFRYGFPISGPVTEEEYPKFSELQRLQRGRSGSSSRNVRFTDENVYTYAIDFTGKCLVFNEEEEWMPPFELMPMVKEQLKCNEVLELTGIDFVKTLCGPLLSTCWVVQDSLCNNLRQFAVFFRIDGPQKFTVLWKMSLPLPTGLTKFIKEGNHLCFVAFSSTTNTTVFKIPSDIRKESASAIICKPLANRKSVFPELEMGQMQGTVIRHDRYVTGDDRYTWSVVTTDSGYVQLTVEDRVKKTRVGRKILKLTAACSLARFVPFHSGYPEEEDLENGTITVPLLISSAVGPCAIWKCWIEMEMEKSVLKWQLSYILEDTQRVDVISCVTLTRHAIYIGCYADIVMVYSRPKTRAAVDRQLDYEQICPEYGSRYAQIRLSAPILQVVFINSQTLALLSTSGLHIMVHQPDLEELVFLEHVNEVEPDPSSEDCESEGAPRHNTISSTPVTPLEPPPTRVEKGGQMTSSMVALHTKGTTQTALRF